MTALNHEFLKSILCCPVTQRPLSAIEEDFLVFEKLKYPVVAGIPVVFTEVEDHLIRIYQDTTEYLQSLNNQVEYLEDFAIRALRKNNKERLLRKMEGLGNHSADIQKLINETVVDFFSAHFEMKEDLTDNETLQYQGSTFQYLVNIYRDWFWKTNENNLYKEKLKSYGRLEGKCLVLGAGAGRFAYDLAELNSNLDVVATDLNYFSLYVGSQISSGKTFDWTYCPYRAESLESIAIPLQSETVKPLKNLHWLNYSFRENLLQAMSFDWVIAPWFCDVVKIPFELILKRVNYLLKGDGNFLYLGPYSFEKFGEETSYGPEEIEEIAEEMHLQKLSSETVDFPYLQDPYCTLRFRQERLYWGNFQKNKHLKFENIKKTYDTYPSWVINQDEPIPLKPEVLQRKEVYKTFDKLYEMIDGKKSIKEISKVFAKQMNLSPAQAKGVIGSHFERVFEGTPS